MISKQQQANYPQCLSERTRCVSNLKGVLDHRGQDIRRCSPWTLKQKHSIQQSNVKFPGTVSWGDILYLCCVCLQTECCFFASYEITRGCQYGGGIQERLRPAQDRGTQDKIPCPEQWVIQCCPVVLVGQGTTHQPVEVCNHKVNTAEPAVNTVVHMGTLDQNCFI